LNTHNILILQGGGSLGAYECGVYQVLAPYLDNLAVVAGTSIGAINASLIAKNYHQEDHGVKYLTDFWHKVLANPSCGAQPLPGVFQQYNAVLTSLLFGNPHMFTPRPWWDSVFTPAKALSFYTVDALKQTLASYFGSYESRQDKGPRLILTAVDIELGEQHAFDSEKELITPDHIVASGSLPPGFPYTKLHEHYYWDGGVWSNTPLPEVLNALQQGEIKGDLPTFRVYIVDVFPKEGAVPTTSLEVTKRTADLTYADKTDYDRKISVWINNYLDLIRQLYPHIDLLPKDLSEKIKRDYWRLIGEQKRVLLDIIHIKRTALPNEQVSGGSDFSPQWIEALMHQGNRDMMRILSDLSKANAQKPAEEMQEKRLFEFSQA
jgi:NTE family protein